MLKVYKGYAFQSSKENLKAIHIECTKKLEEDIEQKQSKATEREMLVRKHLEDTYNLVGKLNYKEIGVRYSNTKEKREERQIEQ